MLNTKELEQKIYTEIEKMKANNAPASAISLFQDSILLSGTLYDPAMIHKTQTKICSLMAEANKLKSEQWIDKYEEMAKQAFDAFSRNEKLCANQENALYKSTYFKPSYADRNTIAKECATPDGIVQISKAEEKLLVNIQLSSEKMQEAINKGITVEEYKEFQNVIAKAMDKGLSKRQAKEICQSFARTENITNSVEAHKVRKDVIKDISDMTEKLEYAQNWKMLQKNVFNKVSNANMESIIMCAKQNLKNAPATTSLNGKTSIEQLVANKYENKSILNNMALENIARIRSEIFIEKSERDIFEYIPGIDAQELEDVNRQFSQALQQIKQTVADTKKDFSIELGDGRDITAKYTENAFGMKSVKFYINEEKTTPTDIVKMFNKETSENIMEMIKESPSKSILKIIKDKGSYMPKNVEVANIVGQAAKSMTERANSTIEKGFEYAKSGD